MKNDGYDNEDSDYILYVNDILGSEEAGHKSVKLSAPGLLDSQLTRVLCPGIGTSSWMCLAKALSGRSSNART